VAVVDRLRALAVRVGPVGQAAGADPGEDLVELALADEERVVLRGDEAGLVREVERDAVDLDAEEGAERLRRRQAEDLGQERRRGPLVAGGDDGVIERDGHERFPRGNYGLSCRGGQARRGALRAA